LCPPEVRHDCKSDGSYGPGCRKATRRKSARGIEGCAVEHPGGQGAETAVLPNVDSPFSSVCPSTRACRGLQQQWPALMQQVIEQLSDKSTPDTSGGEDQLISNANAAMAEQQLVNRPIRVTSMVGGPPHRQIPRVRTPLPSNPGLPSWADQILGADQLS
jgi:hypothetical protein